MPGICEGATVAVELLFPWHDGPPNVKLAAMVAGLGERTKERKIGNKYDQVVVAILSVLRKDWWPRTRGRIIAIAIAIVVVIMVMVVMMLMMTIIIMEAV